jgi:hypothetical protein
MTGCAATAGLAAANGGFFPASWGWSALALLWLALVALVARPLRRLSGLEVLFGAAAAAVAAWTWVSVVWSPAPTQSVLEGERSLVLVAGAASVLVVAGRRPVRPLLAGVLAGITIACAYALATRLAPDRMGSYDPLAAYRLSTPVGYWNGLGLLSAMGVVLAVGWTGRGERLRMRIASAVALIVLVPALYFTFSRGAWFALGAGLAVGVALDPRRLQALTVLLVSAITPTLAVVISSRSGALTHREADLARAAHDGHRVALALLALAVVQALLIWGLAVAQARLRPGRAVRRAAGGALAFGVALVLLVVLIRGGGPVAVAQHVHRSFAAPSHASARDLNARLFDLTGSGRWQLWRAAWQEAGAHPLLGQGAGSFEQYWLANRPTSLQVEDAHNLYLETLAELGPLGLTVLLVFVGLPFAAAARARRHPLVPTAAGAFAAYCIHAAADWDWELAGVTLTATLIATALVLAPRELADGPPVHAPPAWRVAAFGFVVALTAVAFVGLIGNTAAARSETAAAAGNWVVAAADARRAIRWAPWSSVGWRDLAVAQLGAGQAAEGRRSLRRAIAKNPHDWSLWLDLGAASRGRARDAAFAHVRELDPRSPELDQLRSELSAP